MLTAIIDGGAKVVGFDIVFPTSIEQSAVPFGDETLGARRARLRPRLPARARAWRCAPARSCSARCSIRIIRCCPRPASAPRSAFGRNIRALNVYNDPDDVIRRVPLTLRGRRRASALDGGGACRRAHRRADARRRHFARLLPAETAEYCSRSTFEGGADDIPTYSLADLRACAREGDKDFFKRHFGGKVVLIGTVLDVEDRKITSKRFATAPEGRARRTLRAADARGEPEIRPRLDRRRLYPRDRSEQPDSQRWPDRIRPHRHRDLFALRWPRLPPPPHSRLAPPLGGLLRPRSRRRLDRGRDGGIPARAGAAARRAADRRRLPRSAPPSAIAS